MWQIDRTDELLEWIKTLDDNAKEAILKSVLILQEIGPALGRPYVDTVKHSRYKNMKELRIQVKKRILRIFFVFDPNREAILLAGGDKRGNKRFYETLVSIADQLYEKHLKGIRKNL